MSQVAREAAQQQVDIATLPGLKQRTLAKLGKCTICGKHLLAAGVASPSFYVVKISRAMFDYSAIRRQVGLEMLLDSPALAEVMGPDEDIAKVFDGPVEVVVHESCAAEVGHLLRLFPGGE